MVKIAASWVITSNGDVVFTLERGALTAKLGLPGEAIEQFIQQGPRHTELHGDDATLGGRVELEIEDDR